MGWEVSAWMGGFLRRWLGRSETSHGCHCRQHGCRGRRCRRCGPRRTRCRHERGNCSCCHHRCSLVLLSPCPLSPPSATGRRVPHQIQAPRIQETPSNKNKPRDGRPQPLLQCAPSGLVRVGALVSVESGSGAGPGNPEKKLACSKDAWGCKIWSYAQCRRCRQSRRPSPRAQGCGRSGSGELSPPRAVYLQSK